MNFTELVKHPYVIVSLLKHTIFPFKLKPVQCNFIMYYYPDRYLSGGNNSIGCFWDCQSTGSEDPSCS